MLINADLRFVILAVSAFHDGPVWEVHASRYVGRTAGSPIKIISAYIGSKVYLRSEISKKNCSNL